MGVEQHQRTVAAEKRRSILLAAGELFGLHGFERVTMSGLARAASVSLATLYKHFRGKEELFDAIFDERCSAFIGGLEQVELSGVGLEEGLERFTFAYANLLNDEATAETLRLLIGEARAFPKVVEVFFQRLKEGNYNGPLARFLARMQNQGHVDLDDASRAIRELLGMVEGGVLWRRLLLQGAVEDDHVTAVARGAIDTWLARYRASS